MEEKPCSKCRLIKPVTEFVVERRHSTGYASACKACRYAQDEAYRRRNGAVAIPPLEARFWAKVDKNGPVHPVLGTACWVWIGYVMRCGYGQFAIDRVLHPASRASWMLNVGSIPEGMWVLHKCDNRRCVRPCHLFLGTRTDNSADCVAKGRQARGETHGSRTRPERIPRGADAPGARLTEDRVRDIRRRSVAGEPNAALAREYGVDPSHVSNIVLRKNWKHIA